MDNKLNLKKIQMTNNYNNTMGDLLWSSWIRLLCKYGSYEEYSQFEYDNISIPIAIMEYRRYLYRKKTVTVTKEELKEVYLNHSKEELHMFLEYMFLEPIPKQKFNIILDVLHNTNNSIDLLWKRWNKDKNLRIMSIILTLKNTQF